MNKEYAKELIDKTRSDYNRVADDFSRTRNFLPDDLRKLGEYAIPGDKVLDSGCGNGRFFEALEDKEIDYFGIDTSERLISIAQKRYPKEKFLVGDSLNLPFPANFFGSVFSLAVLHHIPTREFRLLYLKEIKRALRPEGILVIRVWDFWKGKSGLKLILKYGLLKLFGKTELDFDDIFLPWKSSEGKIIIERYFHCFRKGGLENLLKEAGFKIKESYRAGKGELSNIYLIAEKY